MSAPGSRWRDASRLYELPGGRQLVLMAARRSVPGLPAVEASWPHGWGTGGVLAPGGVRPDEVDLVCADIAGAPRPQSRPCGPRSARHLPGHRRGTAPPRSPARCTSPTWTKPFEDYWARSVPAKVRSNIRARPAAPGTGRDHHHRRQHPGTGAGLLRHLPGVDRLAGQAAEGPAGPGQVAGAAGGAVREVRDRGRDAGPRLPRPGGLAGRPGRRRGDLAARRRQRGRLAAVRRPVAAGPLPADRGPDRGEPAVRVRVRVPLSRNGGIRRQGEPGEHQGSDSAGRPSRWPSTATSGCRCRPP